MDAGAVAQLDAAQAELEAGNAALLQGAPFLVEMLALQAAAPGMGPVSVLGPVKVFCACILDRSDTLCAPFLSLLRSALLVPKADLHAAQTDRTAEV